MRLYFFVCILLTPAFCQTQLDLGNQSKNIDFSGKPMVRPFRSGTQLPATCLTGEMFFNTSASAGSNSYGCTSPNTWTLQGNNLAGALLSAPLQVTLADSTDLQVGSACTTTSECAVRVGSVTYFYAAAATIGLQSGTGSVFLYVNSSGAITAGTSDGASPALTCSGCQTATSISQFPADSIPLEIWHATSGQWDATGTDEHALLSEGRTFVAGPNIILTESGSTVTISATASSASVTGSGSSGTYDPTDMTTYDRIYVFSETGYSTATWSYEGGCDASGAVPGVAGEPLGLGWGTFASQCLVFYPGGGSYPFTDFISGSTPLSYNFEARYGLSTSGGTVAGTQYLGWSSTKDGTFPNFVGFRYNAGTNVWQCVIRAGGADVASQALPVTPDGNVHTFTLTNGGTANSVGCQIDSGSVTTTGTIPSSSWYGVMGVVATSSAGFTTVESRIHISGINR